MGKNLINIKYVHGQLSLILNTGSVLSEAVHRNFLYKPRIYKKEEKMVSEL